MGTGEAGRLEERGSAIESIADDGLASTVLEARCGESGGKEKAFSEGTRMGPSAELAAALDSGSRLCTGWESGDKVGAVSHAGDG